MVCPEFRPVDKKVVKKSGDKTKAKAKKSKAVATRLYSKAVILGHKRSRANSYPTVTLLKIQGVLTRKDTDFYLGKKVAYVYRAKTEVRGSKWRILWGKIRRPHGNSGVVRAKFKNNMPPSAFGAQCRVMLYPSRI
mmetsp:Transcript_62029/g.147952  ORF Transcript_62029/g.147952 Transcript_62029/m.147952 type:complete len:136 (-) Transcript_62029:57-464(-)|eukprot:CAMPEP_0178434152 /NCGR_PEP_ID=MMETSP0689_2-20121128/33276_1 /TAXON_ID=160604 /ORGANISM="Amphidinium massartii, Strain CS-259" /LENGTH=135 /DNA_ID=CAMNT_0020056207 /DNA_START=85 /DNA_END=492 /DNA_ORIENTATION=+